MREILVADIMTRDPITIKADSSLLDCAKKMVKKKVGSILLIENNTLKGFISQEDILWAMIKKSKQDLSNIKAIDISPKKIATIKSSLTINQAMDKMNKLKFKHLPVVHEKQLIGVITIKDILNFHPEFYPELEEFAQIREEEEKLKRIKQVQGKKQPLQEGICEECGNRDLLYRVNGMLVCESCKNSG